MKRGSVFPVAVLLVSVVFFSVFLFAIVFNGKGSISHTGYLGSSPPGGGSVTTLPGEGGSSTPSGGSSGAESPSGINSGQALTVEADSDHSSSGGSGSYESRTRKRNSATDTTKEDGPSADATSSGSEGTSNDVYASPGAAGDNLEPSGSSQSDSVYGSSVTIFSKQQVVASVAPEIQNKYNLDPSRTEVQTVGEDFAVSKVVVKSSKKVHFFGVIPVYMPVEVVKSLDDSSENVNRPWWAYFVSSN